ncbi:hypothetical protein LHV13_02040 [Ferrovum sp. PN-J185]|uniref:hypothetical protein n=1 Tax=Ferrovum sp. PN-J185 TaxID=1356306 RepID=UPI0007985680|nr:hypothetical protein [Ferrovum sp. PN-J185]KXW55477.1 hypothetical protein FV185_12440 [Ferrovum sp. PN-J185]MCC6067962.1 hypothetical protein [Ferrovum sp. PN-J185]MDE1892626.1 hypothetical protein [Betaproteobacteria bacterium]MDE2057055.1 hypothetical protein [Betaproteobacteria bacterium]
MLKIVILIVIASILLAIFWRKLPVIPRLLMAWITGLSTIILLLSWANSSPGWVSLSVTFLTIVILFFSTVIYIIFRE